MVDATGTVEPVSVGKDRCEGGGKGESAGASLTESIAAEGDDSGGEAAQAGLKRARLA
jgi:hypothetical protein